MECAGVKDPVECEESLKRELKDVHVAPRRCSDHGARGESLKRELKVS